MRALIQRVKKSKLSINGELYSKIDEGLLVLLGITHEDNEEDMKVMVEKIVKLRIFEDSEGKMNLSLLDIKGEIHVVSQFTLYADCHHGNRPGFTNAAEPELANELYEKFVEYIKTFGLKVGTGLFGADMQIDLINNGPVTIMLECVNGKIL